MAPRRSTSSARRASAEPLARTRRLAPTLYVLILTGACILLTVNHLWWLTLVLLAANGLMIAAIIFAARQPADAWTGPRLRRPRD